MAALEPDGAAVPAALLEIAAGTSGFIFKAKPVVVAVVVAVLVDVTVEVLEAAPGALRLKPRVPAPAGPVVVAGAQRESPVVAEVGAAAIEAKSVGPALVAAAVGVGAGGWLTPAALVAGVDAVKANPVSTVGCAWAALPREPMLKPEVPAWDVLPLVNENPPDVVAGAVEVVEEPNTKPVDAIPWLEVTALDMALVRVLPPSPKPPGFAVAGVAVVLLRLSFGTLIPKEKPAAVEAGVVPKVNPGVCVAGAWVVSEKRLVEGALEAGWEGVPKVNPPVLGVEKENPMEGVVVAVFAVPNVNPPVEAPVLPKLNALMVPDSGGSSYSSSQSKIGQRLQPRLCSRSRLLSSTEAAAASLFRCHGVSNRSPFFPTAFPALSQLEVL